jgi:hypothetical protein
MSIECLFTFVRIQIQMILKLVLEIGRCPLGDEVSYRIFEHNRIGVWTNRTHHILDLLG